MKTDFYGLSTNSRCKKRREHKVFKKSKSELYDIAVSKKSSVTDLLKGNLKEGELKERIRELFDNIPFTNERTRTLQANKAVNEVLRFFKGEKRDMRFDCGKKTIHKDGLEVEDINPTMYCIEGECLEVILLKTTRMTITQTGKKRDASVENSLQMYYLLLYARSLYEELKMDAPEDVKEVKKLKASYVSLVREDDKFSNEEIFELDFYKDGGRNYISLSEEIGKENETDEKYRPLIEEFLKGDEDGKECGDCEGCPLKNVCGYKEAPKIVKKMKEEKIRCALSLSNRQKEIIHHSEGIGRVNAGAGSGKTTVVALNVVYLLTHGVKPENILLLTYTKTGAVEMTERIKKFAKKFKIKADIDKILSTTYHSFGDLVVKANYETLGFKEEPKVIDKRMKRKIISHIVSDDAEKTGKGIEGCNYWNPLMQTRYVKGVVQILYIIFDIIKEHDLTYGDEDKIWEYLKENGNQRYIAYTSLTKAIDLYGAYDDILHENSYIDYSDQEKGIFDILRKDPYYFDEMGWSHIIVDEFQDSNEVQVEIIKRLIKTPAWESLLVVGDDAQAIFGYRKTSPKYMIEFQKIIGMKVKDYVLEDNYRSVGKIIDFANVIDSFRSFRLEKKLVSRREDGVEPVVKGFEKRADEYSYIVETVKKKVAENVPLDDICVIAKTKGELLEISSLLSKEGIQSVNMFPEPFMENSKVRGCMALFDFYKDTETSLNALEYLNVLCGGTILDYKDESIEKAIGQLKETMEKMEDQKPRAILGKLLKMADNLDKDKMDELYQEFLNRLKRNKSLHSAVAFIEDFELFGEDEEFRKDITNYGVCLTTAHSSKGMEWKVVINSVSKYDEGRVRTKMESVEEHTRLLFVSVTRARDELYVTGLYDAFRGKDGENKYLKMCYDAVGQKWDKPQPVKKDKKKEEKKAS